MKTRFALALALALAAPALVTYPAYAQTAAPTPPIQAQIAIDLASLQDPAWQNRRAAFYDLIINSYSGPNNGTYIVPIATAALLAANPALVDSIRLAFIALLSTENMLANSTSVQVPEEYTNYYADVIGAVASLQDPRAVDALLGAIDTGDLATQGLAKLGTAAFGKTVALFSSSSDESLRDSAIIVLSEMVDSLPPSPNDGGMRTAILAVLKRALRDPSPGPRTAALEGLTKIPVDDASVRMVSDLAATDPYEASQAGGNAGVFPVREAAQRALRQLKTR